MVPVDLQLTTLSSSDPLVASVSVGFSPVLAMHLPRRPSKRSARIPASTQQTVGSWQPMSKGAAELRAIVIAAPPYVGSGAPTEDVNVT